MKYEYEDKSLNIPILFLYFTYYKYICLLHGT